MSQHLSCIAANELMSMVGSDKLIEGDAVLNVDHIAQNYANNIKGNVTSCQIENGMHDLILSKKPVREKVYATVFEWIDTAFK